MSSKNILNNNKKSLLFMNKVINPFSYSAPNQSINHQKNVFTVVPTYGPGTIYNRRMTFEIPKNVGYLSELYLETQITSSGDNSSIQDRLGSRIYKKIYIETQRGPNQIQENTPDYINARIDLLQNKELMIASMEPNPTLSATTSTVYTPLFFTLGYDTNFVETIQINAITNDSYNLMGLSSNTITNIVSKLYLITYTIFDSFRTPSRMISYNCYSEEPVAITTSSTSTRTFLECDKQITAIHMVIRNTNQEYFRINSFSLESSGKELFPTVPSFINNNNCDIGMTYTFYLNSNRDRTTLAGLNLDGLQPLELIVNYDTIGSDYSLYIFYEYSTIINISSLGSIDSY